MSELIALELVSPSLGEQIKKAIVQLDSQIAMLKVEENSKRIAA